jgi:hypothetical protein
MGVFSWNCAKTGVEISNFMIATPDWTHEVVLLRKDTHPIRGSYNGYGCLHRASGGVIDFWQEILYRAAPEFPKETPKLILLKAYAGEGYDDVGFSENAENQGHFLHYDYADMDKVEEASNGWKMPTFKIEIKQLVPDEKLDHDDRLDMPSILSKGARIIEAVSEGEALDIFHSSVPIARLEDFEITIEEIEFESHPNGVVLINPVDKQPHEHADSADDDWQSRGGN